MAAHKNNYEILKILLDRGATLPMPHDARYTFTKYIQAHCHNSLSWTSFDGHLLEISETI